jgi:hypothetical protein
MIRKRLSKSVPGAKRPWLIESDVVSHPVEAGEALGAGVRGEAPAGATLGDKRVTFSLAEMVTASLLDGWPQDEQNFASGGMSAAHAPQRTWEF